VGGRRLSARRGGDRGAAGRGQDSVTLALARVAAHGGERVCVLDCDVRQPAFGRLLDADSELGLSDLLMGQATDAQVIRQDTLSGMRFIAAGTVSAMPSICSQSAAMVGLLARLRDQFDLVLLDAAPAQAMTDTRIIAGLADATLLCLRWNATRLALPSTRSRCSARLAQMSSASP